MLMDLKCQSFQIIEGLKRDEDHEQHVNAVQKVGNLFKLEQILENLIKGKVDLLHYSFKAYK